MYSITKSQGISTFKNKFLNVALREDAHCAREVDAANAAALGAASPQADSYSNGLNNMKKRIANRSMSFR